MAKTDGIELDGKVINVLPNAKFKVKLDSNGHEVVAYLSGRLKSNFIKVIEGDKVKVEISVYDLTRGRIIWRSK